MCDGAALSHVKHRSVLLVTMSGVAIGGGGVVVVVDMYRLHLVANRDWVKFDI